MLCSSCYFCYIIYFSFIDFPFHTVSFFLRLFHICLFFFLNALWAWKKLMKILRCLNSSLEAACNPLPGINTAAVFQQLRMLQLYLSAKRTLSITTVGCLQFLVNQTNLQPNLSMRLSRHFNCLYGFCLCLLHATKPFLCDHHWACSPEFHWIIGMGERGFWRQHFHAYKFYWCHLVREIYAGLLQYLWHPYPAL